MLTRDQAAARAARVFPAAGDGNLADLAKLTAPAVNPAGRPLAAGAERNVLRYGCAALPHRLEAPALLRRLKAERAEALATGPGVAVLKGARPDRAMLDHASGLVRAMIEAQIRSGAGGGDHLARPGANDRVRNSRKKHSLADPENVARSHGNPFRALIAQAWPGPFDQMTAQLAVVNPGGAAQSPHRDHHLGFPSAADIARDPLHVQMLSPFLAPRGRSPMSKRRPRPDRRCGCPSPGSPRGAISPRAARTSGRIPRRTASGCRRPRATCRASRRRRATPPAPTGRRT
jgi:hypothetical protein